MRMLQSSLTVAVLLISLAAVAVAAPPAEEGFKPLFDGKTLDGWEGDPEFWCVEHGTILGSTEGKTLEHNSFLISKKTYKNFILKVEFKLRNHNSGVQVRSTRHDDFVVSGYQTDIADSKFMGILYEEKGRGILVKVDEEEVGKHFDLKEWNEYTITCNGPNITQQLNGFTTVEYTEEDKEKGATEGIIAFQVHRGPEMKVWFRNVRIKELP